MRKLLPYFLLALILSGLAGWQLPIGRLYPTFQPIVVCLSIMSAAIFVRLNRGMPTLDWRSVRVDRRRHLTDRILKLSFDYVVGLAITSVAIVFVVCLIALGHSDANALPLRASQAVVGAFIFSVMTAIIWMAYVIWRDYDIVRLQKTVIDEAAEAENLQNNVADAEEKLAKVRSATVSVSSTSVQAWPQ